MNKKNSQVETTSEVVPWDFCLCTVFALGFGGPKEEVKGIITSIDELAKNGYIKTGFRKFWGMCNIVSTF